MMIVLFLSKLPLPWIRIGPLSPDLGHTLDLSWPSHRLHFHLETTLENFFYVIVLPRKKVEQSASLPVSPLPPRIAF
jgi:hypothetical protein